MNIDERIKHELESESLDIDHIMEEEGGLMNRITGTFKGGMRRWVILINISALLIGVLLTWTGYRFYLVADTQSPLFWGLCFVVLMIMQGFVKNWLFMEMNRNSIMREIKRVEISIARIKEKS
ncbi:MAG: DUF6768 family protein [Kangiellaceae bacterium]